MDIEELKKRYDSLRKKHRLPIFEQLNRDFEIEKIDKESDTLLRVIRKLMMDKVIYALSFIDMLLNPVNAPRIYFKYIKNMSVDDKNMLEKVYETLGDLNLRAFDLEIEYSEEKEAEQIAKVHKGWESVKPLLREIFGNMKNSLGYNDIKREKSYFG